MRQARFVRCVLFLFAEGGGIIRLLAHHIIRCYRGIGFVFHRAEAIAVIGCRRDGGHWCFRRISQLLCRCIVSLRPHGRRLRHGWLNGCGWRGIVACLCGLCLLPGKLTLALRIIGLFAPLGGLASCAVNQRLHIHTEQRKAIGDGQ